MPGRDQYRPVFGGFIAFIRHMPERGQYFESFSGIHGIHTESLSPNSMKAKKVAKTLHLLERGWFQL
jgi:hypothetical protein